MNDQDLDRLLEQSLSGAASGQVFRVRVLMDSTAAFLRARRTRPRWHLAALSAAAVFIAAVSFLLGRCSAPLPATGPVMADTVLVPRELVAWLDAAQFFKQLGMNDRMGRALDRAGRLLPEGTIAAGSAGRLVFPIGSEAVEGRRKHGGPSRTAGLHQSGESMNRVVAQSLGD